MEYRSIKGFTGLAQLGFLFAFVGFGFILAGIVQYLLTSSILPQGAKITDIETVKTAILSAQNVGTARLMQVLGTCMLFFVPAILWNYVSNGKNLQWLGFNKHFSGFQIAIGFMIIFAGSYAAAPLADFTKYILTHFPKINEIAKQAEAEYNQQVLALSNLKNGIDYVVALFIMAFFPALFEEVFFRAVVQKFLTKWWAKPIVAIIITSILFSLVHWSIYLFLSRLTLGLVLGFMYYKTKNIWVNVIAHFINNAFALTALYVMKLQKQKIDLDKLDPKVHWSMGIVAIIALVGLFLLLTKYSQKNVRIISNEEEMYLQDDI